MPLQALLACSNRLPSTIGIIPRVRREKATTEGNQLVFGLTLNEILINLIYLLEVEPNPVLSYLAPELLPEPDLLGPGLFEPQGLPEPYSLP